MAFVKLDTGILDSTLWLERDLREVFITALLMAQPCEFSESKQQIAVDSLESIDFHVPPGWYGFVQAAGMGIINRAGVDRVAGMEALRKLGNPEFESRSNSFDGRRMVRVNGGYVILNFMQYRDKDHTASVRAKNLRFRKKFGIDALLKDQEYKCDCCESLFTEPYSASVIQDHHHASGENRGLICHSCNIIIGLLETKKQTYSPKKAICLDYIKRYGVSGQENAVTTRDGTQAEAEAEAEAEADQKQSIKDLNPKLSDDELPVWLPLEAWTGWTEIRKKKKSPVVGRSKIIALNKLTKWHEQGYDLTAILDAATFGNWQGLYLPKDPITGQEIVPKPKPVEYVEVTPDEWWGKDKP